MTRAGDILLLTCAAAAVQACQPARQTGRGAAGPVVTLETAEGWRGIALPQHSGITEDLPGLFRQSAAAARRSAADRELLDPDLTLPRATPAPGAYRCRTLRLGTSAAPARARRPGRESFCFVGVSGDRLSLTLETAVRPLGGFLWDTNRDDRLVFLGAEFAARARTAPAYGDPAAVATAGLFERIGEFRYRLVVRGPVPGTLDVYELIAAPAR